jgi:murein DD-endopeptidase MepM/ murein hydrolase activator NlpD
MVIVAPLVSATAPHAPAAIEVRPGTVVRWSGEATRCRADGASWAPLEGACYFPIDLLAQGALTVERTRAGRAERRVLKVGEYPYPEQRIEIQDQSKVDLSPADLARAEREEQAVARLFTLATPRRFNLPLGRPLTDLPAGGRFGSRRWFNGQPRNPHTGADFTAAAGTPVLAVADGRVVLAAEHFFSGNSVFLDHGDGLITMYFHLSRIGVKPGQVVKRGEELGRVGATGRASGPHLHVGVRWHGARIDPEQLLTAPQSFPAVD